MALRTDPGLHRSNEGGVAELGLGQRSRALGSGQRGLPPGVGRRHFGGSAEGLADEVA